MDEAIRIAVEKGGYKERYPTECLTNYYDHVALDPLFWKALGKALGWEKDDREKDELIKLTGVIVPSCRWYKWHRTALRYFDLVLAGDDTDQFWKDLLKK